jgi:excisionase family DNA binding protein
MMDKQQNRLALSLAEFAESLGISVEFVRQEIRRNRLYPTRLGKRVLITSYEARRYLERNTQANVSTSDDN